MSEAGTIFAVDLGTTFSCIAHIDAGDQPVVLRRPMEPSHDLPRHGPRTLGEEELFADILKKVVGTAEGHVGRIRHVLLTCPADQGSVEWEATRRGGEIAGLRVCGLVSKPTAAALAYGVNRGSGGGRQTVLVFDLGGGTFDVSLLRTDGTTAEILFSEGDQELGGRGWDIALARYLAEQYRRSGRDDLLGDPAEAHALVLRAEAAKVELSRAERARVVVGLAHPSELEVTRARFEELTEPLLNRALELTHGLLMVAAVEPLSVGHVFLAGGSTLMPRVSRTLEAVFPGRVESHDPHEAVARGAALYARQLLEPRPTPQPGVPHDSAPTDGPTPETRPTQQGAGRLVVRWHLRRGWWGPPEAVAEWRGDPSRLVWVRVMGKINGVPSSAEDGELLGEWDGGGQPPATPLRLPLKQWRPQFGEVFCRLFVGPADGVVVYHPSLADALL